MIITKTPYRISFFGGGSDYPNWFNKFTGQVLSTTIDKHIYITCRFLPKFFKLNGAIYIVKRDYFIKKKKFVSENSNYYLMENKDSINLDTKNDLILYKNFLKKIK